MDKKTVDSALGQYIAACKANGSKAPEGFDKTAHSYMVAGMEACREAFGRLDESAFLALVALNVDNMHFKCWKAEKKKEREHNRSGWIEASKIILSFCD